MTIQDQLVEHEALRLTVYPDSKGILTLGVGRVVDPKRTTEGISKQEAFYLLNNDIGKRTYGLDLNVAWWRSLDDVRQRVLLDMSFQMGVAGLLTFQRTLAMVKSGNYPLAAAYMLQSKWAREDSPNRARRLAKMMETGRDVPYETE